MKPTDEDEYRPYLFCSENHGSSWKSISEGLPDDRINYLLEDPYLPDLIYIGTDRGVFVSPDEGKSWIAISKGMTTASVQKLAWAEGWDVFSIDGNQQMQTLFNASDMAVTNLLANMKMI